MSRLFVWVVLFLLLVHVCSVRLAFAQNPIEREAKIKTAALFYLAKFTTWPREYFDSEDTPFGLCVFGSDPIHKYVPQMLDNRLVNGHPIRVMFLAEEVPSSALTPCAILYLGNSSTKYHDWLLQQAEQLHTLVVTSSVGSIEKSGMVRFKTDLNRVQIEVNLRNIRRAGLVVSSDLLELAKIIGPR